MGLFLDGPVPLDATATFTQNVPTPSNLAFTNAFPRREYATDWIDFAEITKTNRAARYRNWDGAPAVSARDTGKEMRVKMLPLGDQLSQGEYERRQQEFARLGGTVQSVLVDAVYNDLQNLTNYVYNRVELAWGDALVDGKVTIKENQVDQEVDYGIPAEHTVAPNTLWSDTTNATPLTDLIAWSDVYEATNGEGSLGRFVTSKKIMRLLERNKEIIDAVHGSTVGRTRVTLAELNALMGSEGLPSFGEPYNSNMDVEGVSTRVIPENKLIFMPDDFSEVGFTAWGTPTTAMELQSRNVQLETGAGIVGVIVREDGIPFRKFSYVDAVALPVIAQPKKLLVSTPIA